MLASLPADPETRTQIITAAYRAGDAARDAGRISPKAHMLYEWCLRLTHEHTYIFAGLSKLAELIGCCAKSIQRRFDELVTAGLVWRKRRINRSWLTYITALAGPPPQQVVFFDDAGVLTERTEESSPPINQNQDLGGGSATPAELDSETGEQDDPEPRTQNKEPRIEDREILHPSAAAPAAEQPEKNIVDPVAVAELRSAGLGHERTILDLAARPLRTIRSAIAVQKREGKGAGYTVFLLTNPAILAQKEALYVNQQQRTTTNRRPDQRPGDTRKPWADVGPSRDLDGTIPEQPAERVKPWAHVGPSRDLDL
jgi:hypothetical protein